MSKQLPAVVVDRLLDRLASDDDFRDQFKRDPRTALTSLLPEGGTAALADFSAWSCLSVRELASKDEIARDRDLLRSQLCSTLLDIPHRLDVD